jgi:diguanylate cyclase (GGDEF)-like protein/PAS domain S-box-containing protein
MTPSIESEPAVSLARSPLDEGRFRALVEHAPDLVAVLDERAEIVYIAPSVQRLLGHAPAELVRISLFDLTHPDDFDAALAAFQSLIATPGPGEPVELRLRHANGSWRYVEALGYGALSVPDIAGVLLNARDISDRKRREMQLAYQAFHDPLTGLPNRIVFADRLAHALSLSARRGDAVAVLFLDLDRFKTINDGLGHDAGDQLLIAVAERVRDCLRSGDTVARLGGDEFTVLLEGVGSPEQAVEVAQRLGAAIAEPVLVGHHALSTTASIGIALSESDSLSPDEIMRQADAALYQAKANGRARFVLFNSSVNARAQQRIELEAALRLAIDSGQLAITFQPAVDLRTGRVASLKALPNWSHPALGARSNGELLALAQALGLGQALMRASLRGVCGAVGEWELDGEAPVVGVNVPAAIAHQAGFAELLAEVLAERRVPPACLRLEITESAALEDRDRVEEALHDLARIGVRLAIDDFGIGQSSLAALKHLPVDALIIDQSFVAGLHDVENVAIVRAIVILARTLELQIAAEGIESQRDLEQARILGCDLGRGAYISPPVTPQAVPALLRGGSLPLPV